MQQKEDEEMARQIAKEEADAEAVRRQKNLEELQNASGHVPGFGSWRNKARAKYPPGDMRNRARPDHRPQDPRADNQDSNTAGGMVDAGSRSSTQRAGDK